MSAFKRIERSESSFDSIVIHKTQNLDSSSEGVHFIKYVSGSSTNSFSSSYWVDLQKLFYLSGSPDWKIRDFYKYEQFAKPFYSFGPYDTNNPQHRNKFHEFSTGSVVSVPHLYFGERIEPGTFKLVDKSHPSGNITLRDDTHGNLYAVGNTDSRSNASPSSSTNYIGNIFYEFGLATINETGSYSGSGAHINYIDMGSNYTLEFDSNHIINSYTYTIKIKPNEFNATTNWTARGIASGSKSKRPPYALHPTGSQILDSPWLLSHLTASGFMPYMTQIHLYGEEIPYEINPHNNALRISEPLISAYVPRPIQMRDDITLVLKIKVDT